MPTITTRVHRLLKQTDRMKQQAIRRLLGTLKYIDRERKQRTADLEEAAKVVLRQLADLGHRAAAAGTAVGRAGKPRTAKKASSGAKKRRIRRSPAQLKAEATKVLSMITKAGKEGIGGTEIRKSVPGVGQDIKGFVEKNAGVKLKTTGQKVKMRYHTT